MGPRGLAPIVTALLLAACGGGSGSGAGGDATGGSLDPGGAGGQGGTGGLGGAGGVGGTFDPDAPGLDSLVPDTGLVGTVVELRGRNLQASRELVAVFRPGVGARVLAADRDGTWIRVVVPAGAASGIVSLRLDGESLAGPSFTVTPGHPLPQLEKVTPDYVMAGAPRATVSLDGWGFIAGTRLLWDETILVPETVTPNRMEVFLPEVLLRTPGRRHFRVENPAPGGGTSDLVAFQVSGPFNLVSAVAVSAVAVKLVFDQPPSPVDGLDVRNFHFECTS